MASASLANRGAAHTKQSSHGRKRVAAQSRLLRLSLYARIASVSLLVLSSHLQHAFDTSHVLLSYSLDPDSQHGLSAGRFQWALALLRWDTIYFVASASPAHGYQWEQTLAFQPGIVALLRALGYVTPSLDGDWSPTSAILLCALLANVAALFSPVLLYRLTYSVTKDAELAYTAALLSVFAPSAATTLAAPTPEAFFSFASLMGMLALERATWILTWTRLLSASMWFALATSFRSNGVLLVGYIGFKLARDARSGAVVSAAVKLVVAMTVCMAPSVAFQAWAYSRFCLASEPRPWCAQRVPSVYTFVQSHYWDVGWLRYWHLAQLPHFLLAAPVLSLIAYTARTFWRASTWRETIASLFASQRMQTTLRPKGAALTLASCQSATPYVVHSVALGLMLLFASHVQIALRLATPGGIPALWWGAALAVLYSARPWMRRAVVSYFAIQCCVATVLYAGFYPPA